MIISGNKLKLKVHLAHMEGKDNYYVCRKCKHTICWCCGDVCDTFDHDKQELCSCMNEGCEVEINEST